MSVALKRPVNELFGSLIDSNSFSISISPEEEECQESSFEAFPKNPASASTSSHNNTTTDNTNTQLKAKSFQSSSSFSRIKRLLSRPKIMNQTNNDSNNNSNNNSVPVVQAQLVLPESETTNNINTAVPIDYFQYNEQTLQNDCNTAPIPSAPTFTTIDDDSPEAQEHLTSQKARYGSDMGRIYALEEKEQIKRASANAKAFPYFERKRVEAADAIAKRRDREGFDVKVDKYFDESGLLAARKKKEEDMKKGKMGSSAKEIEDGADVKRSNYTSDGYQVAEYDTVDYDCAEYNTTEYKSVYDK